MWLANQPHPGPGASHTPLALSSNRHTHTAEQSVPCIHIHNYTKQLKPVGFNYIVFIQTPKEQTKAEVGSGHGVVSDKKVSSLKARRASPTL